jgi:hypothetical protein
MSTVGTSFDDPSGAALAARAHEAGVVQPANVIPNHDVTLHFVYRGTLEEAEKLRDDLLFALLQMPAVQQPIDNSVSERTIGPPA